MVESYYCDNIKESGDIVVPVDVLPASLTTYNCLDYVQLMVCQSLYEPLCHYNEDGNVYELCNAELVEISDDCLRYTFHLKKDLRWSDGQPIKADDYVEAFREMAIHSEECPMASVLSCVTGWLEACEGNLDLLGVMAESDYKLSVALEYQTPYLFEILSTVYSSPVHYLDGKRLSNGPYVVAQVKENVIVLEKNGFYQHQTNVRNKKIRFELNTDMADTIKKYKDGIYDMTCYTQFPFSRIDDSLGYQDFHVRDDIGLRYVLHFSERFEPDFARALKASINRMKICGELAGGLLPCYSLFGGEDVWYDIPKFNAIEDIELIYSDYYPNKLVAEALSNVWKEQLGIDVRLRSVELDELVSAIEEYEYSIALDIIMLPVTHPMAIGISFLDLFHEEHQEEIVGVFEAFLKGGDIDYVKIDNFFFTDANIFPLFTLRSFYFKQPQNAMQIDNKGHVSFV